MADPQQPVEQQVTSQTPATKQKNPKRVAAGKAIAQRTKMARKAQKKALIEAQSISTNKPVKQADPPPVSEAPSADPPAVESESTKNVLTTAQWLSVISNIVSLPGIYYKREEIKSVFTQKNPVEMPPSPVLLRAPPPPPPPTTIACHSKSGNQKYGLNILFVFCNNGAKVYFKLP